MYRIIAILITVLSLSACVTPMRLGISDTEWQNYSPEEQKKIKNGYYKVLKSRRGEEEKVVPDGSVVNVKISGGQVNMPPFAEAYQYNPVEFEIQSGACKTVKVLQEGSDKTVSVQVCYHNKTLYVDPSKYDPTKRLGSIQLHYSPIWDRGFTYQNVSSSGYAHLKNVNVAVRRYQNNEPIDSEN